MNRYLAAILRYPDDTARLHALVTELWALHTTDDHHHCVHDGQRWPCGTAELLTRHGHGT
jgi:hypothetical protein